MKSIHEQCINVIKQHSPGVLGIWLFGSAAADTCTDTSDIDLAILLPDKAEHAQIWECAQATAASVHKDIDLIDLISASSVMRAQVLQNGKLIYCADAYKCDLFDTEALADYLRFNEERKELLEDIKARGKVLSE